MARYRGPTCKLARREGTGPLPEERLKPLESKCKLEVPPGGMHGRTPRSAVRLRRAAAREAEAAPHVRRARAAVPRRITKKAVEGQRLDRREPAPDARGAARQRRVPHGLCVDARRGSPARRPSRHHGERRASSTSRRTSCKAGDTIAVARAAPRSSCASSPALSIASQVGFPEWVEVDDKKYAGHV